MLGSTHRTEEPLIGAFRLLLTVVYPFKVLVRMHILIHALGNSFIVVLPRQSWVHEVFPQLTRHWNRRVHILLLLLLDYLEGRDQLDFLFLGGGLGGDDESLLVFVRLNVISDALLEFQYIGMVGRHLDTLSVNGDGLLVQSGWLGEVVVAWDVVGRLVILDVVGRPDVVVTWFDIHSIRFKNI